MSKNHLGEFEEIVMLTVGILMPEAYGFGILEEIEERLERSVSMGSLQTVLKRLEAKGYLKSHLGDSTNVRGGKRKRYFELTKAGVAILEEAKNQRMSLWNALPDNLVTKVDV